MSLVQLQTKIPSVAFQQTLFVKLWEEANRFCRTRREAIFTGLNGMGLNPVFSATCWWLNFILSDEHFGEWFCDQEEPTFVFFRSWSKVFFNIFLCASSKNYQRPFIPYSLYFVCFFVSAEKMAFSSVLIMKTFFFGLHSFLRKEKFSMLS